MLLVTALQSFLVRGLFVAHATLCIWRVVEATGIQTCWVALLVHIILLLFEGLVTFVATKKGEWTVFSPCVLIYLLTVIPCIWILEFDLYIRRHEFAEENGVDCEIVTATYNISSVDLEIIPFQIHLDYQQWSLALQQIFIFVLIIGRWLLPKGQMTRDQLSQLLLVYIGMAADILEFITEGIGMGPVGCSWILMMMILGIWSWSLMQFTIGLTLTKRRKTRVAGTTLSRTRCSPCFCCETEVWAIMVTVVMQDGPFLSMRVYLITKYSTISQNMLFFTAKNALILFLQFYRLIVLFCQKEKVDSVASVSSTEHQLASLSGRDFESNNATQLNKSDIIITSSVDGDAVDMWTHVMRIDNKDHDLLADDSFISSSLVKIAKGTHTDEDDEVNHTRSNAKDNHAFLSNDSPNEATRRRKSLSISSTKSIVAANGTICTNDGDGVELNQESSKERKRNEQIFLPGSQLRAYTSSLLNAMISTISSIMTFKDRAHASDSTISDKHKVIRSDVKTNLNNLDSNENDSRPGNEHNTPMVCVDISVDEDQEKMYDNVISKTTVFHCNNSTEDEETRVSINHTPTNTNNELENAAKQSESEDEDTVF